MSEHLGASRPRRHWRRPMLSRSPGEAHRASTPLELLVDLCFVVAIAQAAAGLHHAVLEGHVAQALTGYAMVFFAIWWAWMNFTWFASAYDTDDVVYRLNSMVQIAGVLVLAAGVPRGFAHGDLTLITIGYVIMRVGLVLQWLRAAHDDPPRRRTALRYAGGITFAQLGWFALLFLPESWHRPGVALLIPLELAVPVWAERASPTTWHPGHIAERYGLLTLIVIGECVLSATGAIQAAFETGDATGALIRIVAGGLLIVFSLWWVYFDLEAHHFLARGVNPFLWGYGHIVVFASMAAVGAGLAVAADQATGHGHLPAWGGAAAVAVPVAIYILAVWVLHIRPHQRSALPYLLAAAAVLGAVVAPAPVLWMGGASAGLVAWTTLRP